MPSKHLENHYVNKAFFLACFLVFSLAKSLYTLEAWKILKRYNQNSCATSCKKNTVRLKKYMKNRELSISVECYISRMLYAISVETISLTPMN